MKGKLLIVPDTAGASKFGVKDVKLQVKHVLHQLGFSEEYRVLAEHHMVRIVKVGEKYRPSDREGRALHHLSPFHTSFPNSILHQYR